MNTKKYYVKPIVRIIEVESDCILAVSGDQGGKPQAGTDPMPDIE